MEGKEEGETGIDGGRVREKLRDIEKKRAEENKQKTISRCEEKDFS